MLTSADENLAPEPSEYRRRRVWTRDSFGNIDLDPLVEKALEDGLICERHLAENCDVCDAKGRS